MARTIAQIKAQILAAKAGETALSGVDSTSKVADWNLWVNVVAYCIWFFEGLLDVFKIEVDAKIAAQKMHTLQWYVEKAKAFQYGVSLPQDSDVYAVVPPDDASVLIVSQAAAEELPDNRVRMKVAKGLPGALEPLSDTIGEPEMTALRQYVKKIKDAGVRIVLTTGIADDLKLGLTIYYDPLVLKSTGERIDGTEDTPVLNAINGYLSALDFNGLFILNDLIDAIELVDGVEIGDVTSATASYGVTAYVTAIPKYKPDAGYLKLNASYFTANLIYIPYTA